MERLPGEGLLEIFSFLDLRELLRMASVSTYLRSLILSSVQRLSSSRPVPASCLLRFQGLRLFRGTTLFSTSEEAREISHRLKGPLDLAWELSGVEKTDLREEDVYAFLPPLLRLMRIRVSLYPQSEISIRMSETVYFSWSPTHTSLILPCVTPVSDSRERRSSREEEYLRAAVEFIRQAPISSLDYCFLPLNGEWERYDPFRESDLPLLFALLEKPLISVGDDVRSGGGRGAFRLLENWEELRGETAGEKEKGPNQITGIRILNIFHLSEPDDWDERLDPVFYLRGFPPEIRERITEITGDYALDLWNSDEDEETITLYPRVTHWKVKEGEVERLERELREDMEKKYPGRTFQFSS